MAPRKTATGDKIAKAKKAPAVKKSEDKIVKRPARGYHKFRNGLLNVTPKGGERELAKQNQTSLLLRLPPKIRNGIWKLVLGGKVYRARHTKKFQSSPTESKNAMALLRTCRQLYAEAALMPLTLTIFTTVCIRQAAKALRKLKPHQRKLITSFQIENRWPCDIELFSYWYLRHFRLDFATLLPCLQDLRIQTFEALATSTQKANEERVRKYLEPSIQGMSVTIKVEQTDEKWMEYDDA